MCLLKLRIYTFEIHFPFEWKINSIFKSVNYTEDRLTPVREKHYIDASIVSFNLYTNNRRKILSDYDYQDY